MRQTTILTGEINRKTVTDPTVPFGRVTTELGEADLVFANLECLLADPPAEYATNQAAFHTTSEGFYAGPGAGEALKLAGFAGVGCANNVTYGEDAIMDRKNKSPFVALLRRRPGRTQPAATPHSRRWLRLQGAAARS